MRWADVGCAVTRHFADGGVLRGYADGTCPVRGFARRTPFPSHFRSCLTFLEARDIFSPSAARARSRAFPARFYPTFSAIFLIFIPICHQIHLVCAAICLDKISFFCAFVLMNGVRLS